MDPELLDYDEEENPPDAAGQNDANGTENATTKKPVKGSYVSIHSSGFRDFLLKPELLRAIVDCGFEHPSEGTAQCIDQFVVSTYLLYPVSAMLCISPLLVTPPSLSLSLSTRRVYPSGHPGDGCGVSGQEWYGQDCSVCHSNTPAAGAH